jgi:hypothetical protein
MSAVVPVFGPAHCDWQLQDNPAFANEAMAC